MRRPAPTVQVVRAGTSHTLAASAEISTRRPGLAAGAADHRHRCLIDKMEDGAMKPGAGHVQALALAAAPV